MHNHTTVEKKRIVGWMKNVITENKICKCIVPATGYTDKMLLETAEEIFFLKKGIIKPVLSKISDI